MTLEAPRWHVNAPWGFFQQPDCFPCRCIPCLLINRQDIMPLPCKNDVAQSSPMPSHSERLRDLSRVQGERQRSASNPLTMQLRVAWCQQANESIGFFRMLTTLLRTKQERERSCSMMYCSYHTEQVLTSDDFLIAATLPALGTAHQFSAAIHHPVVDRYTLPGS